MQADFCKNCKHVKTCSEKNTFGDNWRCSGFRFENPIKKLIVKLCRWVGIQTIYDKNESFK